VALIVDLAKGEALKLIGEDEMAYGLIGRHVWAPLTVEASSGIG